MRNYCGSLVWSDASEHNEIKNDISCLRRVQREDFHALTVQYDRKGEEYKRKSNKTRIDA